MVVTLNIANDKELRSHIKDVIKGQITSVIRDEIKESVASVLFGKTNAMQNMGVINGMIQDAFNSSVKKIIEQKTSTANWMKDIIQPHIERRIDGWVDSDNWTRMINDMVAQRISDMLKSTAQ